MEESLFGEDRIGSLRVRRRGLAHCPGRVHCLEFHGTEELSRLELDGFLIFFSEFTVLGKHRQWDSINIFRIAFAYLSRHRQ